MKPMRTLLLFFMFYGVVSAAPPVKTPDPAAESLTAQRRHPLSEAKQAKKRAVVFFFVTTDCPIANRFAPEINRICRDYEKQNVAFYIVQTDKTLTAAKALEHAKQYKFTCPVLIDRRRELVKFCGASATPEAALLAADGKLLYRGRIDDSYAAWRQPRPAPTRRDLRLALDATLSGKPIAVARTKAIGCYIED